MTRPGFEPGPKPATNSLSYGAAIAADLVLLATSECIDVISTLRYLYLGQDYRDFTPQAGVGITLQYLQSMIAA
jgi:hypothetical protein